MAAHVEELKRAHVDVLQEEGLLRKRWCPSSDTRTQPAATGWPALAPREG